MAALILFLFEALGDMRIETKKRRIETNNRTYKRFPFHNTEVI